MHLLRGVSTALRLRLKWWWPRGLGGVGNGCWSLPRGCPAGCGMCRIGPRDGAGFLRHKIPGKAAGGLGLGLAVSCRGVANAA